MSQSLEIDENEMTGSLTQSPGGGSCRARPEGAYDRLCVGKFPSLDDAVQSGSADVKPQCWSLSLESY